MSYIQPRIGIFCAIPFLFSQHPSQPTVISSLTETRVNGSVHSTENSKKKSIPSFVPQTIETNQPVVDREIIVVSDSESDTETRSPVVSRKAKGKEKATVDDINKNLEDSASIIVDQTQTSNDSVNRSNVLVNDNNQYVNIDPLSNVTSTFTRENKAYTNKKSLLDGYASMSNKEIPSFFQNVNPVRIFLYILENHNSIVELFDIIVDFARIYLEIYGEDKRMISNLHDPQPLISDLMLCLKLKTRDDLYMEKSKRFKQVELLARKAIEMIEQLNDTGEMKGLKGYKKAFTSKRKNDEGENSQEKRIKQHHDSSDDEKRSEQRKRELQERKERAIEIVKIKWKEIEQQRKLQKTMFRVPPSRRLDHPSMPSLSNFTSYDIRFSQPRKNLNDSDDEQFVELLAEPLHDLMTAQAVYGSFEHFTPFKMSKAVGRCKISKIFPFNIHERKEYCKQLYRQYINTDMDSTAKSLERWFNSLILQSTNLEHVNRYMAQFQQNMHW
ncbi:8058_t:CDS:2 [Funneliformis geosporum]|uniref:6049_t:CDS:1 n=1 Tax=Funneliformis geosporum TaxID=1117311 RepID=A0A9W4WJX5_9GLOM|nr:6049_t:CDS:2 [Funneliformis geosporum]CAI2176122.1 8058_t:CDS:2 [Funneliformis geosporum]